MDIKTRLLTIRILDRINDPKFSDTVKLIGISDTSHYRNKDNNNNRSRDYGSLDS